MIRACLLKKNNYKYRNFLSNKLIFQINLSHMVTTLGQDTLLQFFINKYIDYNFDRTQYITE